MCYGENMPLDVLFVRDDDIPDLVQEDVCDLGLVGLNVLEEKRLELAARGARAAVRDRAHARLRPLPAVARGAGRHSITAARQSLARQAHRDHLPVHARRAFSPSAAIQAEIVVLSGAVEIAPRLGRADLICDLVSTGSTLQANHLREVETVLESHAVLIRTPVPLPAGQGGVGRAAAACASTACEQVKESKYIMLHAPRSALPAIAKLLPGSESPTIIPLEGLARSSRGARRVPRERVLGDARAA